MEDKPYIYRKIETNTYYLTFMSMHKSRKTRMEKVWRSGPHSRMQVLSRGLRLNNPGNLRHHTTKWKGEVCPSVDSEFKQFISEAHGYHALLQMVSDCITRYGCTTPRLVIARWAPSAGCPTVSYLDFVCQHTRMDADALLNPNDERQMCKLTAAMSHYENGFFPRMQAVIRGWEMLLTK